MTFGSRFKVVFSLLVSGACAATLACGGGSSSNSNLQSPSASPSGNANILQAVAGTQNPLVAQFTVAVTCPGQAMVEFGPDTSYGRSTAWVPVPGQFGKATLLVAGMRASTAYHMRSQVQCASGVTGTGNDLTFTTGALPALPFPPLTVSRPNPAPSSPENPGIEMLAVYAAGTPAFSIDRDAHPIWYYDVGPQSYSFVFKFLPNGHIIDLVVTPTTSLIREIDLAGNTIRELDISTLGSKMQAAGFDFVPGSYHHDLLPLNNGHLIVLTNSQKNVTLSDYSGTVVGDGIIDLDENWNPVWAWNSFDYLDVTRHLNGLPDWTHSNALVYSASDGNLLLSMRHQSWVLKIDYKNGAGSGNILWKLGYQGDFSLSNAGIPSNDPSLWFSFQHFPSIISQSGPQTTLSIWDNGDNRVLDANGDICGFVPPAPACYSRATVFQLDESQTPLGANLLWADQIPIFGQWGGSINQLPNGNMEFDVNAPAYRSGVTAEVQEVTQTANPQIVWKLDLTTQNAYRAYRVPSLYPGVNWQY